MYLYQIYWYGCHEGDTGGILAHEQKFTDEEFEKIACQS